MITLYKVSPHAPKFGKSEGKHGMLIDVRDAAQKVLERLRKIFLVS